MIVLPRFSSCSIIAAKVVEGIGTKIDIPRWKAAKKEIRELIAANTPEA